MSVIAAEPPRRPTTPVSLRVTVVVPVNDPKAEVRQVAAALGGELERLGVSWECLLVYDGLRGAVWEEGLAMQAETGDQVRTIGLHKPFGETVCLSSAFAHARGELVLTAPQYVQIDPREVERLLAAIEGGADFATSWRHPRVDSWLNRLQSAAFNWVIRRLVGAQFHDLNSTLRLIRREVLEDLTIYGDQYRYLPALAYRQGFRVEEVQVRHLKEWGETGIFGPGVYWRRFLDIIGVMFLTKFTHKPLRFFGSLGAALMALGSLLLAAAVLGWWLAEGGGIDDPLFLAGILLFVLGVQVVGFGLVGEIIVFTQARNVREYRIEHLSE